MSNFDLNNKNYVITFTDTETEKKFMPFLHQLINNWQGGDRIAVREVRVQDGNQSDSMMCGWVDVEAMRDILTPRLAYIITNKREWAALYCVMRELHIIPANTNMRRWALRMNELFDDAKVECSYESIRKLTNGEHAAPIDDWDELDDLYSTASELMNLLCDRTRYRRIWREGDKE